MNDHAPASDAHLSGEAKIGGRATEVCCSEEARLDLSCACHARLVQTSCLLASGANGPQAHARDYTNNQALTRLCVWRTAGEVL